MGEISMSGEMRDGKGQKPTRLLDRAKF